MFLCPIQLTRCYTCRTLSPLVHVFCVYGCKCICQCRCTNCVCVCVYGLWFVRVCIFPAALHPGMQHCSSEGDISADRRASFPSPLPSGVALNIKLFNLIQFPMTNTLDWIQMPATSWPTPGLVCAQGLDTLELGTGAGSETRIKAGTRSGDADGAPGWTAGWKWYFSQKRRWS